MTHPDPDPADDPFTTTFLNLEQSFYNEGHALGTLDGAAAGKSEGRMFALQKGFEKFVGMGMWHGRGDVWHSLYSPPSSTTLKREKVGDEGEEEEGVMQRKGVIEGLEVRDGRRGEGKEERLRKGIRTLWALTEPASLDTANTEDAVAVFEDRARRAEGKGKVVGRLLGQDSGVGGGERGGEEREGTGVSKDVEERNSGSVDVEVDVEMEMDFTGMGKRV